MGGFHPAILWKRRIASIMKRPEQTVKRGFLHGSEQRRVETVHSLSPQMRWDLSQTQAIPLLP